MNENSLGTSAADTLSASGLIWRTIGTKTDDRIGRRWADNTTGRPQSTRQRCNYRIPGRLLHNRHRTRQRFVLPELPRAYIDAPFSRSPSDTDNPCDFMPQAVDEDTETSSTPRRRQLHLFIIGLM